MKKILLIVDGIVSKHLLERLSTMATRDNAYEVIYYHDETVEGVALEGFNYHKFDPTSLVKLSEFVDDDTFQAIVCLGSKRDTIAVVENLRSLNEELPISVLDEWNLSFEDKHIAQINANNILAGRVMDTLPNIPVVAQNVGLGIGEIMEVQVPIGSSFVYRHISSIEQRKWKIVAIYRQGVLKLPNQVALIEPNDVLLIIGEPIVLQNIYKVIKRQLGQFPLPFGKNIYVVVDMARQSENDLNKMVEDVKYIIDRFEKPHIVVRVINPGDVDILDKFKDLNSLRVDIEIAFSCDNCIKLFENDCVDFQTGLIVISHELFDSKQIRESLYDCTLPVLKLGEEKLENVQESLLILSNAEEDEKISSVIFDVSAQMEIRIVLFDVDPDEKDNEAVIDHYKNLSKIFTEPFEVVNSNLNPIRELRKRDNFLQVIPFEESIVTTSMFALFSTNTDEITSQLKQYSQIYVPVSLKSGKTQ